MYVCTCMDLYTCFAYNLYTLGMIPTSRIVIVVHYLLPITLRNLSVQICMRYYKIIQILKDRLFENVTLLVPSEESLA